MQLHTGQGLLELTPQQAAELYGDAQQYRFASASVSKLPTEAAVNFIAARLTWKLFAPPLHRTDLFETLMADTPDPLLAFHRVMWPAFAYVGVQLAHAEAAVAKAIEAGLAPASAAALLEVEE